MSLLNFCREWMQYQRNRRRLTAENCESNRKKDKQKNSDDDTGEMTIMPSRQTSIMDRCNEFTDRFRRENMTTRRLLGVDGVNFRLGDIVKIRDSSGIWMITDFQEGDPKNESTTAILRMIVNSKLATSKKNETEQKLRHCAPLTKQEVDRFTSCLYEDIEALERIFSDAHIEGVGFFKDRESD